jgi:hypothetical protein
MQERVLDRERHGGRRQLREHCAVGKFHEAVDDALRMNHRGALLRAESEQPLGLDQLEAFVGERRGVDRYLWPHRPVRMLQGIRRLDLGEPVGRPVAKRAAAGGQDNPADAGGRVALEALEDGVVLAVDREEFGAAFLCRGHHELAGEHENFLGRQGEVLAHGECGERGLESRGADDGHQHDIRLGLLGKFDEAGQAADKPGVAGKAPRFWRAAAKA